MDNPLSGHHPDDEDREVAAGRGGELLEASHRLYAALYG
jgi:hypothetical protein